MPLQLKTTKFEDQLENVSPFQRELIRKQIIAYKKKMYKIIEEGFFYGVGGIMHFWLWHAVLSSKHIPITYFVLLSRARWLKEQQDQDMFKLSDLSPCSISSRQIALLITSGIKRGHIKRHPSVYGKYIITPKGNEYLTRLTKEMYKVVVDLYDPGIKKDLKV